MISEENKLSAFLAYSIDGLSDGWRPGARLQARAFCARPYYFLLSSLNQVKLPLSFLIDLKNSALIHKDSLYCIIGLPFCPCT
jgi:hypothetical protein